MMSPRRLIGRSVTFAIPLIAYSAILWGVIFATMGNQRRTSSGLRTTLDSLPPWGWGLLMITGGLAVVVFMRPWAVGLLVAIIAFYSFTLLINAVRYPNVSYTGPIWPMTNAVVLMIAGARRGVRKGR